MAMEIVDCQRRIVELEQQLIKMTKELNQLKIITGVEEADAERKVDQLFVLYDTETNGLGKTEDIRILQFGAIAFDKNMKELGTLNKFVNPLVKINPRATAVNGIDGSFVSNLKSWETIGAQFQDWLQSFCKQGAQITLIGHNSKRFDARILVFENARHDVEFLPNTYNVDTLDIFKELFTDLKNYKLGTVYASQFGEDIPDQHTALADCQAMQRLLKCNSSEKVLSKINKFRESFDVVIKRCMKGK